MGKPYSDDLRERVVAAIEAGHSRVKVAELYNMALSTTVGGTEALRTLDSQCTTLLLEQIRTNEAALFDVAAVSLPDRLAKVRERD
jgi:hypothetical protein